ncbi:MAG: MBL fold metallo-hydrolase [Pseudomonadales bacterium]|nr:MBL fold metallo-hydrolase [Pseudomonadales bacterium]
MKVLHRDDLFCWSEFDEQRNLDFNSLLWVREAGNVLIDPLPLSAHDAQHLQQLGGAKTIIITNSDHTRAAEEIALTTGATIYGPRQEQGNFPIACEHWLQQGDEPVPGLVIYEVNGSKTVGELCLLLEGETLITGDLIRCHKGGQLCLLPDAKLGDKGAAIQSLTELAALNGIKTVIVGDGWPVFKDGHEALQDLLTSLT